MMSVPKGHHRISGHCLCGGVTLSVTLDRKGTHACHCKMCRRWAGGPFMVAACKRDVQIDGEENIGLYGSSQWAERGFCRICGSSLFYKLKETGDYFVSSQLFDDREIGSLGAEAFVDSKPQYYDFAGSHPRLTGAEVIAQLTGQKI